MSGSPGEATVPPSDYELLRSYVDGGSEAAFAEVVRRHVGMVYASALRQTVRADLAEEVVQAVFILLARKAGTFDADVLLGGWLFRSVRFAANDLLKAERRRQWRETAAYMMKAQEDAVDGDAGAGKPGADESWTQVAPELDNCLAQLGETDRAAILLRFFEEKSFPEVGSALRLSEEAARKRVNRAVEKLQSLLKRRGVTATALGLGSLLSAQAAGTVSTAALPAGLGAKVTGMALASPGAAATSPGVGALAQTLAAKWSWLHLKPWLAGATAVVAGVAALVFVQSPDLLGRPAGAGGGEYRVAGFPDARRVHAVISTLQNAVARGDAAGAAALVHFPLRLNSPTGALLVPDASAFVADFARIFTPETQAALAKCPRSGLFSSPQGVMVGSGDLWLAPERADQPEPRVVAINLKSSVR